MADFSPRDMEGDWIAANNVFENALAHREQEGPSDVVAVHTDTVVGYTEAAKELHARAAGIDIGEKREVKEARGLCAFLFCCFDKRYSKSSIEDRARVLGISKTDLDPTVELHGRILGSIYAHILELPSDAPLPSAQGRHWERIGFQGENPSTDLRSTGMLGPLQILFLFEKALVLAERALKLSCEVTHEFPFVLIGFNLSALVMDLLDSQAVVAASLRSEEESIPFPVLESLNTLYVGAWDLFCTLWEEEPSRSITDFGIVKQNVRKRLHAKTSKVMSLGSDALRSRFKEARPKPKARVTEEFSSF